MSILLDAAPIPVVRASASRGNEVRPVLAAVPAAFQSAFQRAGRGGGIGAPLPMPATEPAVGSVALSAGDKIRLLGALSALMEQLPASSVRLVVFNLDQHRELLRKDSFTPDAMSSVGRALDELQLGTVSVSVLLNRTGHLDVLARLINRELRSEPPSDAVIFMGARERFHDKLTGDALHRRRGAAPHFFFLAYDFSAAPNGPSVRGTQDISWGGIDIGDDPQAERDLRRSDTVVPTSRPSGMPDTLSRAVGTLKGKTFTVANPRQFAKAISQIERLTRR